MSTASQVLAELYVYVKSFARYKENIFWIIVFPVTFLVLLSIIFGSPSPMEIELIYDSRDQGWASYMLLESLNSAGFIKVRELSLSEREIVDSIANGTYDAALIVPPGFTDNISRGEPGNIRFYYFSDPNFGGIIYSTVKSLLDSVELGILRSFPGAEVEFILEPIRVAESPVTPKILATGPGLKVMYVVGVIGVEIIFIGMYTGVNMVVERKRDRTLTIILSSPMKSYALFLGDTLVGVFAMAISTLAIIVTGYMLGADYSLLNPLSLATISFLLLIGLVSMIGLGLIIAPLARTQEMSVALVNIIAFPLMFLGGILIPRFLIPEWAGIVSKVIPLSWNIEAVRSIIVYAYPPMEALQLAVPGIVGGLALYALGLVSYRKLLEKALTML